MDNSRLLSRFVYHSLVASMFLSASIALAGTESYDYKETLPPPPQSWCVTPPDTEFRIGIPGWLACRVISASLAL
jgi:hypothetical protein